MASLGLPQDFSVPYEWLVAPLQIIPSKQPHLCGGHEPQAGSKGVMAGMERREDPKQGRGGREGEGVHGARKIWEGPPDFLKRLI